jgi:hypothetical protein
MSRMFASNQSVKSLSISPVEPARSATRMPLPTVNVAMNDRSLAG